MIRCKYYFHSNGADFPISPPVLSRGSCKFVQVVPSSSSSSLPSSFDDSVRLLHCRNEPGCCPSWGISSLTTLLDGIFFFLFLSPSPYFFDLILLCSIGQVNLLEITQISLQNMKNVAKSSCYFFDRVQQFNNFNYTKG